jgi:hypothetical protein
MAAPNGIVARYFVIKDGDAQAEFPSELISRSSLSVKTIRNERCFTDDTWKGLVQGRSRFAVSRFDTKDVSDMATLTVALYIP